MVNHPSHHCSDVRPDFLIQKSARYPTISDWSRHQCNGREMKFEQLGSIRIRMQTLYCELGMDSGVASGVTPTARSGDELSGYCAVRSWRAPGWDYRTTGWGGLEASVRPRDAWEPWTPPGAGALRECLPLEREERTYHRRPDRRLQAGHIYIYSKTRAPTSPPPDNTGDRQNL